MRTRSEVRLTATSYNCRSRPMSIRNLFAARTMSSEFLSVRCRTVFVLIPSAPPAAWEGGDPAYTAAGDNMPCPLNADLARAASWSCSATRSLSCQALVTNAATSSHLGQCVPAAQNVAAGLSCRSNVIENSTARTAASSPLSFNLRAFSDRVSQEQLVYKMPEGKLSGYGYNCRPTKIGVPLGRVDPSPASPTEAALAVIRPKQLARGNLRDRRW